MSASDGTDDEIQRLTWKIESLKLSFHLKSEENNVRVDNDLKGLRSEIKALGSQLENCKNDIQALKSHRLKDHPPPPFPPELRFYPDGISATRPPPPPFPPFPPALRFYPRTYNLVRPVQGNLDQ